MRLLLLSHVKNNIDLGEEALAALEPKEMVTLFYTALYNGDLHFLKSLMTEKSYYMTLETFGLRLSLNHPEFKAMLKDIEDDSTSLAKVERLLSEELQSRNISPHIKITKVVENGNTRKTVEYTEDEKIKKLYFSQEDNRWKINYFAGRKIV